MKTKPFLTVAIFLVLIISCATQEQEVLLFSDDYSQLPRGPLGSNVGAHTEYHYLHEAKPKGNWAISTFRHNLSESWFVRAVNGQKVLFQKATNPNDHWHPMIVAGDELWENYSIQTSFCTLDKKKQAGVAFRYRNDRCYYVLGVKENTAFLKLVKHATGFQKPHEKILASEKFEYNADEILSVRISVDMNQINAGFEKGPSFYVLDSTYKKGKVAFLADGPACFYPIQIKTRQKDKDRYEQERSTINREERNLMDKNPGLVLYKKIKTKDFGVARNVRFGDLNEDGEPDVLIGQVVHHGHKDRNSELSCLTAMTFDGEILWQKGKPDLWRNEVTNDVAFQIHDINNDGKNEVIYTMNQMMYMVDAKTGETVRKAPTPLTPGGVPTSSGHNIFKRILGDCIYFCDLQGKGFDSDIILKDRYKYIWAFDNTFNLLWKNECVTGHYPYAYDVDEDGKDELIMGYTLFDDDGKKIWSLDNGMKDHADGVAIVNFNSDENPRILCAASDEGMFFADTKGTVLKHHYVGHVQNPAVANFRDDLPGLETVSINFWGNQGILHLYDSNGNIYHDMEPSQYGSMCLPVNWTGASEEFFILNANVDEGGAYDGWGRKVLEFPDDGHPDMCYAVLDIVGDCRDEIVVWDPSEMWVYTQEDNPKEGKLYHPVKNPLYNSSNYQATVSVPGWSDKP